MKLSTRIKNPAMLGMVLQQGRLLKGISQRELAKKLGVGQKWVWEMEQGKPGLLTERLFKFLEETDVTLLAEFEVPEGEKDA